MRFKHTQLLSLAGSGLLLCGLVTVAAAQQEQDRDRSNRSQQQDRGQRGDDFSEDRADRQRQQQDRQQQDRQQQDRDSRTRFRLSPSGWVRVATDYDNDGRFDAVETLFIYDLQRAQQSSRDRANREASGYRGTPESRRKQQTVRGEIREMSKVDLTGVDATCLVARLKTEDDKTAKVCLGPQSQLSRLDLGEGDQVTVTGVRGHINDKSMLIARQVQTDNNQVSIDMPSGRHLKRVRAEILSTRTAQFRGREEPHVVAQVKTASGKRETVNLGPKPKLERLDLQQGDSVLLLVRPGRINGESAMIAEQIRANGTLVELPRPQDASRFGSRQGRSEAGRQSGRDFARTGEDRPRDAQEGDRPALGILLSEGRQGETQIDRILSGSPAARSELQEGDELIAINGQQVESSQDVLRALSDFEPNDRVEIRFRRNGETRTTTLRLASRSDVFQDEGQRRTSPSSREGRDSGRRSGQGNERDL